MASLTQSIENVIVLGASSLVGREIVSALVRAHFHVTIGTRDQSITTDAPLAVGIAEIDYDSAASLVRAFRDQHAIVEAFNPAIHQDSIVQAAIASGVLHLITPNFSTDTFHPSAGELPIFELEHEAQRILETYAESGAIQWTAIITGPFFDWGIRNCSFWVDRKCKQVGIIGSGDQAVSMSAIDMCGRATVAVLRTPQNFANRAAYFADFTVSNNELLDMVRRINPRGSWKGEQFKLSYMLEMAEELWNKDTETGVEDRVNAPACEMWRLYALFVETEGNDYGADFQDKVEPGFGVTKEVFEFELRRAIGY